MPISPKRGLVPTPRNVLAAAVPFVPTLGGPPTFMVKPPQLSFWGNDVYGDCVTAEEAFAKACNSPEIFVADNLVVAWATSHGVLDGATIPEVMTWMQNDGFDMPPTTYDDGGHTTVDWTVASTLQSAIFMGPVKLGIAADQLADVWQANDGKSGWFATGFHPDTAEDHCVSLCGYGSISWLAQQLGAPIPAGIDGTKPAYAMFTWDSIGIIDVPSMIAITQEAWLRQPTTVAVTDPGAYYYLQVKSSNQYLNILNAAMNNGAEACQGVNNTTPNFLWAIEPAGGGYFFLRVKSSGQYLNVLNASMSNGAMACQGVNNTTDNFLWEFISLEGVAMPAPPVPGVQFYLKVKSSGQYLNILNAATNNGAEACQGVNNSTPNFVWKLVAS
jgi:hypothetical protein